MDPDPSATNPFPFYHVLCRLTASIRSSQGCRSGPFSVGSGSIKLEFWNPDSDQYPDLTGSRKESIQTSKFFHINQISDNWMVIFTWKNGKNHLEKLYFNNIFSCFIQLYIAKVLIGSSSGEHFPVPDPTEKVRIRIRKPVLLLWFDMKIWTTLPKIAKIKIG